MKLLRIARLITRSQKKWSIKFPFLFIACVASSILPKSFIPDVGVNFGLFDGLRSLGVSHPYTKIIIIIIDYYDYCSNYNYYNYYNIIISIIIHYYSVLLYLAKSMSSIKSASLYADLPFFPSPSLITGDSLRSDLVLVLNNTTVYLLELTVFVSVFILLYLLSCILFSYRI